VNTLRSRLRLGSALVLFSFVLCHLAGHSTLLVSRGYAEGVLAALMRPWRSDAGTALLLAAFFVHYGNALWSIYERRTLRLARWEWMQLALGLCIPLLLLLHVASTRIVETAHGVDTSYAYVLTLQWVVAPELAVLQALAVVTLWSHAVIGLHFWLRTKRWYPRWRAGLGVAALLLPTLALAGYLSAGSQVRQAAAADEKWVEQTFGDSLVTADALGTIDHVAGWLLWSHLGLVAFVFAARGVRRWVHERRRPPVISHACGRQLPVYAGASILEALREHDVPHASVCGGRARCTTCRVRVGAGAERLPPPAPLEARALARIGGESGIRLACQVRPTADLSVTPLLAADATALDGFVPGGLEGSERQVTVMFIDLRGSTTLGEAKLPYDVLYVLNRFFLAMSQAIAATRGHYSQFTGDGLMALYGLHDEDAKGGALDALRGAREMLMRVERLNEELKGELPFPLRIGVGIHHSEAIVGMMGPPGSMITTAIGDTVNTTARLESLTKDYDCTLIVSRSAAEAAGLDLSGQQLHEAPVKGRVGTIQFLALQQVPVLPR
jgi:adenylate cyclase